MIGCKKCVALNNILVQNEYINIYWRHHSKVKLLMGVLIIINECVKTPKGSLIIADRALVLELYPSVETLLIT